MVIPHTVSSTQDATILNNENQALLLQAATRHVRDEAIVRLLLEAGLFLSELTSLYDHHVDVVQNSVQVPGSRARRIPLTRKTLTVIKAWMEQRGPVASDIPLFTTVKGQVKGLADRSAEALLHSLSDAAGFDDPVNARLLRNTYAVGLFQSGMTKQEAKALLGISDEGSLNKYRALAQSLDTSDDEPESVSHHEAVEWEAFPVDSQVRVSAPPRQRALLSIGIGLAVWGIYRRLRR